VCAGAHGTEPGGGSRAKPIAGAIGEPDDPDPAAVSVRHPRARGRGITHLDLPYDFVAVSSPETARGDFLESLMDTELYSMGAYFSDEHPELVDEVIARSAAIEERGISSYARAEGASVEETFETLLTGLAVRYYKAVAG
jgi:hypothetical protein